MIKPAGVRPGDAVTTVGRVFGTPVVVKGLSWLPLSQLVVWLVLAWAAGRRHPEWPWRRRLLAGALAMPVVLGSEWAHNLAHAAAARAVGKPMDALWVSLGMPMVIYYDIADPGVTPRQHIARALGGPALNTLVLAVARWLQARARPGSMLREVADLAVGTNTLIVGVGLTPIPVFDGGPILKWALVDRACSPEQADRAVRRVNVVAGAGLAAGAGVAFAKRRGWLGAFLAFLSALALAFGLGWIKEQAVATRRSDGASGHRLATGKSA